MLSEQFVNESNGREYRLEVTEDLLGDWVVGKYFGSHRLLLSCPSQKAANELFATESDKRQRRGYSPWLNLDTKT